VRGFSLIELSIVLVILGLLTGGILAGKSLIRASELRAVGTELTRFQTVMASFKDKYFYLPGDIPNATSFWGFADGGDGLGLDCYETDSTGLQTTCNGNGNGQVLYNSTAYGNESFRFWQHLANAGLIEGNYSGRAAAGEMGLSRVVSLRVNTPQSKFGKIGYMAMYFASQSGAGWAFDGPYGNIFQFGSSESPPDIYEMPVLAPEEMWNIDVKIDDSTPAVGRLRAYKDGASGRHCNTNDTSSAQYNLSYAGAQCHGIFTTGF
jgi:prepilin-type N-terminal cleavage/methylation domain-containing protein